MRKVLKDGITGRNYDFWVSISLLAALLLTIGIYMLGIDFLPIVDAPVNPHMLPYGA